MKALLMLFLLLPIQEGDPFLGRWQGHYQLESSYSGPFETDVVPLGKGAYQLWVRMGERGSRYEIQGLRQGDKVLFQGRFQVVEGTDDAAYDLTGEISDGRLTGRFESPEGNGTIELAKLSASNRASVNPPDGAVTLFEGRGLQEWKAVDGGRIAWKVTDGGALEASGADLVSKQAFGTFRLHLEFLLPLMPEARGQERANSGIVVAGSSEVHILDSFGEEPTAESCGAIFGIAAPRLNACLPPLEWQAMDVTLRAGEITVTLNGVTIHERRKILSFQQSPVRLRSTGSPVRFRNIWVRPLEDQ
ncbi:MAG: DUF1080 domain-containing protein [Acidobacteriota bacterium]